MRFLCLSVLFAMACLGLEGASQPVTPNTLPKGVDPNQWPEDFNPQTREERVDTETSTDEDVIIMEEDEDSENLPGNTENPSQ